MKITYKHQLGLDSAKKCTDEFFNDMTKEDIGPGFSISDINRSWENNTLIWSFKVKKGFILNLTIRGKIQVNKNDIIITADLPNMISALVSQDSLEEKIIPKLDKYFKKKQKNTKKAPGAIKTKHIEFWSGGDNPEQIHVFKTLDEAEGHYIDAKDITYHKNQYRVYKGGELLKTVCIGDIQNKTEFKVLLK